MVAVVKVEKVLVVDIASTTTMTISSITMTI